ncbi:MAG: IgGFc-binding protein [Bacteroidetes bacterium]|nr:IgGFc-binding protein [Bacteroidota bacterium]
MKIRNICAAALALVAARIGTVDAQGLNSDGRDFYVGFLSPSVLNQHIDTNFTRYFGAYALVSSYADNEVSVSYFDNSGNETAAKTYTVGKLRAVQIPLDTRQMRMSDPGEIPEYRACHISARGPVNVTYFSVGPCSGGSYLASSTAALGTKYVVQSYHDNIGGVGGLVSRENSAGYFMVIGAFDGTTVTITPSATTAGGHTGVNCGAGATGVPVPFTIGLNRGQCYMVKSAASGTGCNISGSTVVSDKPVAVLAGHENALTDGSDPQLGGGRALEARDYMVEQMLPVEFWDTSGYFSVPFIDSQEPANAGQGDEYEPFTGIIPGLGGPGPSASNISMNTGTKTYTNVAPYKTPPQLLNWASPVDFTSTNGTKIAVVQYDQRMQGAGAPYPAPSQLTVIPRSTWRSSYAFFIPNNQFEILQGYYLNLICSRSSYDNRKILVSVNGAKPAPLPNGLATKKKYAVIPDTPELVGYSLSLGPGSYYLTDTSGQPFQLVNYGFRAFDPDRDLGDFDGDDFFFSYASPAGFVAKGDSASAGKLVVTVDTLCDHWHICAIDRRIYMPGIKAFQLADDPNGYLTQMPIARHNLRFDPTDAGVIAHYPYELIRSGFDTQLCADMYPEFPGDTAYGSVFIVDNAGHSYRVDLRSMPKHLTITASPNYLSGRDTLFFPSTLAGGDTCATLFVINNGNKDDSSIIVTAATLDNTSRFAVAGLAPTLPIMLAPGDSLRITICYTPSATDTANGMLHIQTLCGETDVTLRGTSGYPVITATDLNFGTLGIGKTSCKPLTVTNIGAIPFTLVKGILSDTVHYSIDPQSLSRLPMVLTPGRIDTITVCYRPNGASADSARIDWVTDQKNQSTYGLKTFSMLTGFGQNQDVQWTSDSLTIAADTTINPVEGIGIATLWNARSTTAFIRDIHLSGPDAAEFQIAENQRGIDPPRNFNLTSGEMMWQKVRYSPDLSRAWANVARHALLVVSFNNEAGTRVDSDVVALTGTFKEQSSSVSVGDELHTPPTVRVVGKYLVVSIAPKADDPATFELFDLLGRKIAMWPQYFQPTTEGNVVLPLPQLTGGLYALRISCRAEQHVSKIILAP